MGDERRATVVVALLRDRYQCSEIAARMVRATDDRVLRRGRVVLNGDLRRSTPVAWDMIFDITAEAKQRYAEVVMVLRLDGAGPVERAVLITLAHTVAWELRVPVEMGAEEGEQLRLMEE